jgi:hypothetical protein
MATTAISERRRNYACERCGRAFARSEHLKRHVLAHDKRKPFHCTGCGTSYGRADVLQRHMKKCQSTARETPSTDAATHRSPGGITKSPDAHGELTRSSPSGLESTQALNYADFTIDEGFLEDTLLFQFNYSHSGLTKPPTPIQGPTALPMLGGVGSLQLPTPESVSELQSSHGVHNALHVTAGDVQYFYDNIAQADPNGHLAHFRRPSLSRISRCLTAYYQYFDLHTPVVHFASLKIAEAHPALVLIVLAIGAVHLAEPTFSQPAYEAACVLLGAHQLEKVSSQDASFHLWYAQCAVLCAQYGACTGEPALLYRAQQQLFAAQGAIYEGLPEIERKRKAAPDTWGSWIYAESCSRVVSWMFIVSAMCLALDASAVTILPPMPCSMPPPSDESVWHALSEPEWRFALQLSPVHQDVDLWTVASAMMVGEIPRDYSNNSAFTLLALIGAILATICTKQRLSQDIYNPLNGERKRLERAIAVWERLWRSHPRAERNMTRLDHPLLNDCLSLLGSSYFHLYLGSELHTLEKIAKDPHSGITVPECRNRAHTLKVVKFAANSWLVRAKLGIAYLNKTGGLELGSQALITAYESALVLAWWLHVDTIDAEATTNEERADALMVKKLFDEIREEIGEQNTLQDAMSITLNPIDFYLSVLDGRVWKCATIMEQRLRNFERFLETR